MSDPSVRDIIDGRADEDVAEILDVVGLFDAEEVVDDDEDAVGAILASDSTRSPIELAEDLDVDIVRVYRRVSRIGLAWDGERWLPKAEVSVPVMLVDPACDGNYKNARDCNRDELLALVERYRGEGGSDEAP